MEKRPRLGIIGGMGSVAAAYFFKRLVELTPAQIDQNHVETFLHNNPTIPDRTAAILYGGPDPMPELKRSVEILNRMGSDYIILACMTSHYFIPQLREHSKAVIIDGLEQTAERCRELGVKKVGVMATNGSISMNLFQKPLHKLGIESLLLDESDQETYFMQPVYAPWGIKAGNVEGKPKVMLAQGAQILIDAGAEAIIAGCTELPLVMKPEEFPVPLVDTIDVLLGAAINKCLGLQARQTTAR